MSTSTLRASRDAAIGRAMRLELHGFEQAAERVWTRVERLTHVLDRREAVVEARRESIARPNLTGDQAHRWAAAASSLHVKLCVLVFRDEWPLDAAKAALSEVGAALDAVAADVERGHDVEAHLVRAERALDAVRRALFDAQDSEVSSLL